MSFCFTIFWKGREIHVASTQLEELTSWYKALKSKMYPELEREAQKRKTNSDKSSPLRGVSPLRKDQQKASMQEDEIYRACSRIPEDFKEFSSQISHLTHQNSREIFHLPQIFSRTTNNDGSRVAKNSKIFNEKLISLVLQKSCSFVSFSSFIGFI